MKKPKPVYLSAFLLNPVKVDHYALSGKNTALKQLFIDELRQLSGLPVSYVSSSNNYYTPGLWSRPSCILVVAEAKQLDLVCKAAGDIVVSLAGKLDTGSSLQVACNEPFPNQLLTLVKRAGGRKGINLSESNAKFIIEHNNYDLFSCFNTINLLSLYQEPITDYVVTTLCNVTNSEELAMVNMLVEGNYTGLANQLLRVKDLRTFCFILLGVCNTALTLDTGSKLSWSQQRLHSFREQHKTKLVMISSELLNMVNNKFVENQLLVLKVIRLVMFLQNKVAVL